MVRVALSFRMPSVGGDRVPSRLGSSPPDSDVAFEEANELAAVLAQFEALPAVRPARRMILKAAVPVGGGVFVA